MVPEEMPSAEGSREDTVKSQEGEKGGRGCEKEKPGRGREDEKGTRWAVRRVSVRKGRGAGARGEGARLGAAREPLWGETGRGSRRPRVTGQRTDWTRSKKGDRAWRGRVCSGRTVFTGETDQGEQRERLRPGDGKRKGGCQRQTKGDVLGESQRKCWSTALTF